MTGEAVASAAAASAMARLPADFEEGEPRQVGQFCIVILFMGHICALLSQFLGLTMLGQRGCTHCKNMMA